MITSVDDIRLIKNQVIESRGNSIFVFEPANEFFEIKRVFTITGEKIQEASRGFHAHRTDLQIISCVNGSVSLTFRDGIQARKIDLKSPDTYVFVPNYIWGETRYLEKNTVVTVYSSGEYDEKSYIRNYEEFLQIKENLKK